MENRTIYNNAQVSVLETNKVLRNTYSLLAMTLLFSAVCAAISMAVAIPPLASMGMSLGALAIVWFVIPRVANSASGIVWVFAFTGLLGGSLGYILNRYMGLANGGELIMQALGATALVFFSLSGYALTSRKDFSFMGGFLFVGLIVAIIAAIANIFLQIPAMSLAINAAIVMIMSGLILFDTSRIINGGERNYIMATVGLYLSIYNLFTSILHLLGAFGSED